MNIQDNYLTLADGQQMPQEGFGLYKVDGQDTMTAAIQHAFEDGYRLFDTAQLYGNEAEVGTALKQLPCPAMKFSSQPKWPKKTRATTGSLPPSRSHCKSSS